MEIKPYIVYVKTDKQKRIININSSAFLTDTDGWAELDSGFGDKCHHAQGNYFPLPIMDDNGIYRYKLLDGKPVERTQAEMDVDRQKQQTLTSTPEERIAKLEAENKYLKETLEILLSGATKEATEDE